MKYLFFLTCLALSGCAYAQEPVYTPMKGNYKFKGLKADTLLLIPSFTDTTTANSTYLDAVPGAMIRCGNDFWMRNAGATAWLQNVNVGSGASPSVQYVDSVYRKAGKDSIYWRRSGNVLQFKDSTGGADSPDRINGKANANVTANMDYNPIYFINIKTFSIMDTSVNASLFDVNMDATTIESSDITINATDTMRINVENGNEVLILNAKNRVKVGDYGNTSKLVGDLQYGKAKRNIDLTSSNDTILIPGTYMISNASTNHIYLPAASNFPGQTIYIINTDGATEAKVSAISGNVYDQLSNTISDIKPQRFSIWTSDGTDWYGYNTN